MQTNLKKFPISLAKFALNIQLITCAQFQFHLHSVAVPLHLLLLLSSSSLFCLNRTICCLIMSAALCLLNILLQQFCNFCCKTLFRFLLFFLFSVILISPAAEVGLIYAACSQLLAACLTLNFFSPVPVHCCPNPVQSQSPLSLSLTAR